MKCAGNCGCDSGSHPFCMKCFRRLSERERDVLQVQRAVNDKRKRAVVTSRLRGLAKIGA